jgi:hypothetical protein
MSAPTDHDVLPPQRGRSRSPLGDHPYPSMVDPST